VASGISVARSNGEPSSYPSNSSRTRIALSGKGASSRIRPWRAMLRAYGPDRLLTGISRPSSDGCGRGMWCGIAPEEWCTALFSADGSWVAAQEGCRSVTDPGQGRSSSRFESTLFGWGAGAHREQDYRFDAQERDQVVKVSAEPVELPDRERVTGAKRFHAFSQARTVISPTGRPVLGEAFVVDASLEGGVSMRIGGQATADGVGAVVLTRQDVRVRFAAAYPSPRRGEDHAL
jgi:hypothetical protein